MIRSKYENIFGLPLGDSFKLARARVLARQKPGVVLQSTLVEVAMNIVLKALYEN